MKIKKVEKILNSLSKIKDRPIDNSGNLDVVAFNKLPEVKKAVSELKELGANKNWLSKHFVVASMILKIN